MKTKIIFLLITFVVFMNGQVSKVLTTNEYNGVHYSKSPSSTNYFVTKKDTATLGTKLTKNEYNAIHYSHTPTQANYFLTKNDSALFSGTPSWHLTTQSLTGTETFGSYNAQPIKFYTSNAERIRIDENGKFGLGCTPTFQFHMKQTDLSGNALFVMTNSVNTVIDYIQPTGQIVVPISYVETQGLKTRGWNHFHYGVNELQPSDARPQMLFYNSSDVNYFQIGARDDNSFGFISVSTGWAQVWNIAGDTGIGTETPTARVEIVGHGTSSSTFPLLVKNSSGSVLFKVFDNGRVSMPNIPTSSSGLSSGDIYSNAGILTIVP